MTLGRLLVLRGHVVSVMTYYPHDFYLPSVREAGIGYECIQVKNPLRRIIEFRQAIRFGKQDVVLTFMETPSLLAELAALPFRRWGLVVSERTAYINRSRSAFLRIGALHRIADHVTANSHTNRLMLEAHCPWLRGRITTVYNAVDMKKFGKNKDIQNNKVGEVRLLAVGRLTPQKNALGLLEGLHRAICRRPEYSIRLDWYGDKSVSCANGAKQYYNEVFERMCDLNLQDIVNFHEATPDIAKEYRKSSALVHASFFEGLPNVICEAMSCGLPVLASEVCDNSALVIPEQTGLLFDPRSPESIAEAILRFCKLDVDRKRRMVFKSMSIADKLFSEERFASHYENILVSASQRKRIFPEHWIPDVPETATKTLESHMNDL